MFYIKIYETAIDYIYIEFSKDPKECPYILKSLSIHGKYPAKMITRYNCDFEEDYVNRIKYHTLEEIEEYKYLDTLHSIKALDEVNFKILTHNIDQF